MKFLPLIWAGLWRKPTRTVFTFLSIVVAFLLLGLLAGVNAGFNHLREVSRLDRLMVDSKFGQPILLSYRDQLARIPGVTVTSEVFFLQGYYQDSKNGVFPMGIDAQFFAARDELTATKAEVDALMRDRTGAIVTIAMAKKYGWKVGDKIPIQTTTAQKDGNTVWTFDLLSICDDVDHPGTSNYFMVNYDYIDQGRTTLNGTVSRFLLRIRDPEKAAEISAAVDKLFESSAAPTRTNSEKANAQAGLQSIGDISYLTNAVGGAVLFMLLFLTGNSMMQSVRERIPEFGVMKTLGFSDIGVLATVLAESITLFIVGALIGLAASKQLVTMLKTSIQIPLIVPTATVAIGIGFSVIAAVISAIIPAWRVKRLSVIDALAGR